MQTYGETLHNEQEVLMLASDIIREAFAAESAMLRADDSGSRPLHLDAAAVIAHDGALRADGHARVALAAMTSGDTLKTMLAALKRFLKITPVNTVAARRRIADAVTEKKGYIFA